MAKNAHIADLEHLVVQDIFLTETAYLADVILPATAFPEKTGTFTNTDRMVQLGRKALDAPGEAKPDWLIVSEVARRAVAKATPQAELLDAEVQLDLPDHPVFVMADPGHLARIVDNLLNNALAYSRGRPWVRISARRP